MTPNAEHPITRLTIKMERAERDAARLDAWTRDPANEDSCDWEYEYREFRRAQARARRCKMAILRIDAALYGMTDVHARAMAAVTGTLTYHQWGPTYRRR